jgi:vitamin B12 transporter
LTLGYDRLKDHVDGNPGGLTFTVTDRVNNGLLASYFVNAGAQSLQASIRHDDNSQFGDHVTGNIGYGYRITPAWRVTGNFGTAFRAPTFDDLFWPLQNFGAFGTYQGNPNLKPETSRNKEVGLVYEANSQRVSANIYHNDVKNLIIASQGLFNDTAANVGSATLEGVTLAYQGEVLGLNIRSSADIQNPIDNTTGLWLARRAHKHGALWLGHEFGALELGGEIIASGKRFDDAANTRELGGYELLNLTANYKFSPEWSLNARANNVLDKDYTLATAFGTPFNTPGANVFVSLRWQSQ